MTVFFCTDTMWTRHGDRLLAAAPGLRPVLLAGDEDVADADLSRIEVAYFSGDAWPARAGRFIGACLRAPNLRWLHTFSAGVDSPVFARFLEAGVRLTNSSGSAAPPIAQTAVMMMLALSRDLPAWGVAQREHRWAPHRFAELEGTTLAVVGMGPIGCEIARLGIALRMRVIGCRRTPSGDEVCETWPLHRLDDLLAEADWIVLALPLADGTRGLIGAEQFALMRPGARLVNVGRGELVDEEALVSALVSGQLGGAGLDVFATEPLPADSALWDMANVIVTPHSSGASDLSLERATDIFVDNLERWHRGDELRNEIFA
ncbi:MAG: D-2-hydroxyacid dehydrogenase [Ilumatobacteraceae bacterium]|nr:MAG: D-2-hydroxyacid dehydrogenase [Actinomycetota bacterium]